MKVRVAAMKWDFKWMKGFLFDLSMQPQSYYGVFAVLLVLQICPIWLMPYPAMHDYPNHLARIHILHQYGEHEPYQATYRRDTSLIPNLAMDLVVPALMDIVSIETASKIFLSLVVASFNLGLHCIGLAVNSRPHWNALAATFFTYNFAFAYGFVNYLFGLGIYFIALSVWIRYRAMWTVGRMVSAAALAMLCYLSHLSAFVFLWISVVCLTAFDVIRGGRLLKSPLLLGLMPLALPAIAHIVHGVGTQDKWAMTWWHPLLSKKIIGFAYPFLTYDLILDFILGVVFVLFVLLSAKVTGPRFVSRDLFLIGAVFIVIYLISPMSGARTSYIDRRFLLPAMVFLLLGIRIDVSRRLGQFVMIGLLGLSFVRVAEVWYCSDRIAREVQSHVRMLDLLPDGMRIYPMVMHDQSSARSWLWDMHFFYTAHYATVYRHAFVPTIYAWEGAHPLNMRFAVPEYVQVGRDTSVEEMNWQSILSKYDYVWGYKLPVEFKSLLLGQGDLVAESGVAMLIRVKKQ